MNMFRLIKVHLVGRVGAKFPPMSPFGPSFGRPCSLLVIHHLAGPVANSRAINRPLTQLCHLGANAAKTFFTLYIYIFVRRLLIIFYKTK